MKIGNLDIKKAYFGTIPLTSSNAFIGEVPIIAGGPAPVIIDYFYLQPSQTADYSIDKKDFVYVKGDTFEFSKDKTNWRRFDSLTTSQVTRTLAAFMSAHKDYGVLALSISAYNTYVVGQGLEVGCYNSTSPVTGSTNHGATATLITTDANYAYYMCQIGDVPTSSTQFRWFIQENGTTTYTTRSYARSVSSPSTPYMVTWDGETTTSSGITLVDPGNYSVNVTSTEITETIHLNANDKLYLRNTSGLNITSSTKAQTILIPSIQSNVNYNIGGILHTIYDYTVESFEDVVLPTYYANRLFYNDTHLVNAANLSLPVDELSNYCFYYMFNGCTSLTAAPALPATTLATYCYSNMFNGCTSLTAAPALPATTLTEHCYDNMFYGCTALVNGPTSLGTSVGNNCCASMFYGCTALTAAPALPATTLGTSCYNSMFYGCTSLTAAPALPATTLEGSCYSNMFNGCTALTAAPALPATTLANYCYSNMFKGCTSLVTAPALPATTLATYCYNDMFSGCTSLVTAPALPATTLATYCYNGMFSGCTSLVTAPALPATTLVNSCYNSMFYGCTSLTAAPALPATTLATACYGNMFQGCTSLVTAPALPATTLATTCYGNMFNGCTLIDYIECMAVENINSNNCYNWLSGVAATGTFKRNVGSTTGTGGWILDNASGIPSGWTNEAVGLYVSRNEINASAGSRYYGAPYFVVIKASDEINITTSDSWLTCSRLNSSVAAVADDYKVHIGGNNTGQDRTGTITVAAGDYTQTITVKQCRYESDEMFTINAVENSTIGFEKSGSPTITPVFEYSLDGTNWFGWAWSDGYTIQLTAGQKVMIRGNNSSGINNSESVYNHFYITGNVTLSGNIISLLDSTMSMTSLPVDNCLYSLFTGCTGITKAHELVLPLQTVRQAGYNKMFYHCTSLYNTPHLQASVVNGNGYIRMFEGCTSLVDASPLRGSTLGGGCYANMFISCTSLTHAPEINETATASDMLYNTFNTCKNLRYIRCMTQSQTGTTAWMNGVQTNGGLFVYRNGTSWSNGTSGVPTNWTKVAA